MHIFQNVHGVAGYITLLANLSYPSIFLALIASGHVIPIPEGATLVLLGYLAGIGTRSLWGLFIISIFSVWFFDVLMYTISRSGSSLAERLLKKVKIDILEKYKDASNKDVLILIVISHFVPGWRFANPLIAGVAEVSWHKFLSYSLVAASIYAPLYICIGYFFHSKVFILFNIFKSFNHFVLPITMIGLGIGILAYVTLEKRRNVYNKPYAKE